MTGEVTDGDGNTVQVHSESEIESFKYGGGLFGVNCGHYPIPFFPGFSRSRPPQQNEEQNAREYAESQQQRALERNVRDEKRELEVMKAQGATQEELDAQKIRVRNANTQLTEFCDKTGRARQPGRTATPINATFPDGYQQTKYGQGIRRRNRASGDVASQATQKPKKEVELKPATNPLVTEVLPKSGIEALPVAKLGKPRTEEEIIKVLGGGDQTKGSCSSLAYAYAGQKAGYDVVDFRGGLSQDFFSTQWLKITRFEGVDGIIQKEYNDFVGAHTLLAKVEAGKEYYFSTGRHAAIVRKTTDGILQYLELQSSYKNGWGTLDDRALRYRFAAKRQHSTHGFKYNASSTLVDIAKFAESPDFVEMLQYINTEVDKQKKGVSGGIK
jgi:hypothetical protein